MLHSTEYYISSRKEEEIHNVMIVLPDRLLEFWHIEWKMGMDAPKYCFIGPKEVGELSSFEIMRARICSARDVKRWIASNYQNMNTLGEITVTFVRDEDGDLWISDRSTEHVARAKGQPALAAGELTFSMTASDVSVVTATNQSTGYCPDPSSWNSVETALNKAGISHPSEYTGKYIFRRCDKCRQINLVKDETFECAVCGFKLNKEQKKDE